MILPRFAFLFLSLLVPLMAVVLLVLLVYGQTVTRRALTLLRALSRRP